MRHVIYLLLVANLVFFGWHMLEFQKQDEIVRALPAIPATAAPLVTLQEMEQKQGQEPGSEPELKSGLDPELLEPVPEPELESGLDPELLEPVPEPEPEPELEAESELEAEPEPELLEPNEDLVMIESLTELQPPGGGDAIICRTLGPIMAASQLKLLGDKLDELGLEPRHRTSESREANGYWVYLPAMKYSQALEIRQKLDEHNDKEYYIGKDNFISLGAFKIKSRAEVRMHQVGKLGLEALLEPRYKTQIVHWLDIDQQAGDAVDLGVVVEEYPGIKLQEQACY
jgi:hypothetical protein